MISPTGHPEPSPAQEAWRDLGFGLLVNFGPRTLGPVAEFRPRLFGRLHPQPEQWVDVAVRAGARYLVLTVKAADGFCVWPSRYTQWCTRQLRGAPDLVATLADACADADLEFGLSYSLADRRCACYGDDARYAEWVRKQVAELLGDYGRILHLAFEGIEDKVDPLRPERHLAPAARWLWPELYAHCHRLQPDCLILPSPPPDYPGTVPVRPLDLRGAADWDLVVDGRLRHPVLRPETDGDGGDRLYLPLEIRGRLTADGWPSRGPFRQPGPVAVNDWYRRARAAEANFLLAVPPGADGRISPAAATCLQLAARERDL